MEVSKKVVETRNKNNSFIAVEFYFPIRLFSASFIFYIFAFRQRLFSSLKPLEAVISLI
jgi:hypothetical protein